MTAGFIAFLIFAYFLTKHFERLPFLRNFILTTSQRKVQITASQTSEPDAGSEQLHVHQRGLAVSPLRPAGKARFGNTYADVVTDGAFIEKGKTIEILRMEGNRVIVRETQETT